jgi:hypothetical protein
MKSALAKYFQKLVRCNSCLGPLITSPPQITVFTLDVINSLSTGTYNYKSSPEITVFTLDVINSLSTRTYNYKSSPEITVFTLDVINSLSTRTYNYKFYLTTGYFTKYKSSPDMYNGIIFISIKCFFLIKKTLLFCTYVMHISGIFHYLSQFSFFLCLSQNKDLHFKSNLKLLLKQ